MQELALQLVGPVLNFLVLLVLLFQLSNTRRQTASLSRQTAVLENNVKYNTYLRQVDELNIINHMLLDRDSIKDIFKNLNQHNPLLDDISLEEMALSWLIINRYEGAFVGYELNLIPEHEWDVWKQRLQSDFSIPFVRRSWTADLGVFEYNISFKEFVNDLLKNQE